MKYKFHEVTLYRLADSYFRCRVSGTSTDTNSAGSVIRAIPADSLTGRIVYHNGSPHVVTSYEYASSVGRSTDPLLPDALEALLGHIDIVDKLKMVPVGNDRVFGKGHKFIEIEV
jgi:hypothetical protein